MLSLIFDAQEIFDHDIKHLCWDYSRGLVKAGCGRIVQKGGRSGSSQGKKFVVAQFLPNR